MPAKQDLFMPKTIPLGINQNSTQSVTGNTPKVVTLNKHSLLVREQLGFFPCLTEDLLK